MKQPPIIDAARGVEVPPGGGDNDVGRLDGPREFGDVCWRA